MARVSDARDGYKETARFGMLNIWDVKSLGHDAIREGGRYLVSPLLIYLLIHLKVVRRVKADGIGIKFNAR